MFIASAPDALVSLKIESAKKLCSRTAIANSVFPFVTIVTIKSGDLTRCYVINFLDTFNKTKK